MQRLAFWTISPCACIAALVLLAFFVSATAQSGRHSAAVSTWKAGAFAVGLDDHGLIVSLRNTADNSRMEWASEIGPAWGIPVSREVGKLVKWGAPSVTGSTERANELLFTHGAVTVRLQQSISTDDRLNASYTITNTSSSPLSLAEGDFGIILPLPDNYPAAVTALTHRANVHIWTGGSTAWIEAERMNGTPPHLGLVLTQGSLTAYSITDRPMDSNDRGTFVVHPPSMTLAAGKSTTIAWSLFWNVGWDDFFAKAMLTPEYTRLQAEHYTVIEGQPLRITADAHDSLAGARLTANGHPVEAVVRGNHIDATYTPTGLGIQRVELTRGNQSTILNAFVSSDPLSLVDARVRFIMAHQQEDAPGQPFDGAFVAFDNETGKMILEPTNDHNAGRERVGMGVLLALYLPSIKDPGLKAQVTRSLDRYWNFVTHHLQDSTGKVFNNTDDPGHRLYNYPWVARLHLAMYQDTKDPRYLDAKVNTIRAFYVNGGERFYPIDLPIVDALAALDDAKRTEQHDELVRLYRAHADRLVATGTAMPTSEVNYEQSIVAPACAILLETYLVTNDRKYLTAATPFIAALFAFNGEQPDFHLNDVSIRHWDDYWFGKARLYGDTFPHYWSTITSLVLDDLAQTDPAHAAQFRTRAMNIIANNLSLFSPDGKASCASVYPLSINDRPGRFYDPWANDQDWALVHYLLIAQ
jgi:hypothetical protein